MNLLTFEEFSELHDISDNVITEEINYTDIINTLLVGNKIRRFGNRLTALHIQKAKEEISKSELEDPNQKIRSEKRIRTLTDKIDAIEQTIASLTDDIVYLKSYLQRRSVEVKANAKLKGLELKDRFYQDDKLDDRIKDLKTELKIKRLEAEKIKKDALSKNKEEIKKAEDELNSKKDSVEDEFKDDENKDAIVKKELTLKKAQQILSEINKKLAKFNKDELSDAEEKEKANLEKEKETANKELKKLKKQRLEIANDENTDEK